MAAGKKPIVLNPPHLNPKRIAAAVALALAAGSGSAWAAGLGRLTVQSALGQPLRAEVEITAVSREEASSLSARLPEASAFRQAGLEFNPSLRGLRFAVERRQGGRPVVVITSTQPLNEPFVDLLVELNWAAGKFVREYTFLLDPPELRIAGREVVEGGQGQLVTAAVPPASATAPAAAAPAAPAPAAQAKPVPPAAPAAPRPTPSQAAAPAPRPVQAPGALEVSRGDTLSGIATRVRPEGVSLDQVLISLYQANPDAFFGSIHQLKAGASLSVPDRQAMASIDAAQAREQVRVQTRDFNEYRSRLAESARSVPAGKAGQSVAGSVTARVEDKGAPTASSDQLRLSKSETPVAAAGTGAGATGTATSKSGAGAEQSVARDAALRESESRVAELEKNVGDLQRLLELKNRQLADLQLQVEAGTATGKAAAGTIAKADSAAPVSQAPAVAPAAAPVPAAPVTADATPATPAAAKSDATAPAPSEAPKAAPAEAPKPAPVAAPRPVPEQSFVDDLMSNPLMLPGLGAILALGAGYGWYAMRRRRKVEKFEDSLIAAEGFSTNSLFGSTGGQNVDTSSSVFSSSTKDSGVDVHSTEVDPIAEAEVYIAYGREAQAEEILKEALRRQPDRQAIRAKLLEILSGRKDTDGFNQVAGEMHRMTGGQNEEWPKVVTMGLALDPENALYTGLAPAPDESVGTEQAEKHRATDEPTHADTADVEAVAAAPEQDEESAVDFGVLEQAAVSFAETRPLAEDEPKRHDSAHDEVPSLDFDLDLDTTIGKAGGMLASSREATQGEDASELERAVEGKFDLPSLDLSPAEVEARRQVDENAEPEDHLNIDLPALEGLSRTGASRGGGVQSEAAEHDTDLASIGLDLEPAPAATSAEGVKWQEMSTKLDLASAYEEIGDKEGARELLEEVVKGGDGEQQQKARSMLQKIV